MPGDKLFEYAVLRVVPKVERGEFINVGVVLYCPREKFLDVRYQLNEKRLVALSPKLDFPELQAYLEAFEKICHAREGSGTIGKLPIAERFRWLSATRSTILQTSRTHSGLCEDAGSTLLKLFAQLVE